MAAQIGAPAPDFTLRNHDRQKMSLADLRGAKSLVVFVPWPFTRVCTAEICDLRDNLAHLDRAGVRVVSITVDTLAANHEWARAEGITYPILSDFWPHGEVSQAYGCFNEKFGVADRTTYVLDADGVVRDIVSNGLDPTARTFESYQQALAAI